MKFEEMIVFYFTYQTGLITELIAIFLEADRMKTFEVILTFES